jgi:hypothetical protein
VPSVIGSSLIKLKEEGIILLPSRGLNSSMVLLIVICPLQKIKLKIFKKKSGLVAFD